MEIDTLTKISTDHALDALCYYLERIGEHTAFEAIKEPLRALNRLGE